MLPFSCPRESLQKKDAVFIDGTNFQPLKNEKVLNCTVKFINNGKFNNIVILF